MSKKLCGNKRYEEKLHRKGMKGVVSNEKRKSRGEPRGGEKLHANHEGLKFKIQSHTIKGIKRKPISSLKLSYILINQTFPISLKPSCTRDLVLPVIPFSYGYR